LSFTILRNFDGADRGYGSVPSYRNSGAFTIVRKLARAVSRCSVVGEFSGFFEARIGKHRVKHFSIFVFKRETKGKRKARLDSLLDKLVFQKPY
jgi:hypothetical protein